MDGQTTNPLTEAGGQAMTLSQALGSLLSPAQEEEQTAAPVQERQPPQEQAQEAEPAAEEAQPENETTEQETEELPPLQAPSFWKKDARDIFATLPRDAQEKLLEQERERNEGVERAMREAAEKRKSAESEILAAQNERQRIAQQLQPLIQGLQQSLQTEFADIKTPADVVALAQRDPARYAEWRARMDAIQFGQAQQRQLQEQQAQEQRRQLEEYARAEWEAFVKAKPEYKDRTKWEAARRDLRDYALSMGYSEQDFDNNISHRHFLVLEKAMLYDRAQQAKANAVVKPLPKVQVPGSAKTKADMAAEQRAAQLKKLEQSGSIEDAIGLLRRR